MGIRTSRLRRRVAEFVATHGPCEHCGADVSLEVFWRDLDYRPVSTMQAMWDLGQVRRDAVAGDLIVLCHQCMRVHKTGVDHGGGVSGIKNCTCIPCQDKRRGYFRDRMREHRAKEGETGGSEPGVSNQAEGMD